MEKLITKDIVKSNLSKDEIVALVEIYDNAMIQQQPPPVPPKKGVKTDPLPKARRSSVVSIVRNRERDCDSLLSGKSLELKTICSLEEHLICLIQIVMD
jgi:hypothetical protein